MDQKKLFSGHEFQLIKNDTIYLFSDGYPDQFGGEKDKKFLIGRFKKLLLSIQHLTMNEQESILHDKLKEWIGEEEQVDDILIIGLRI